MVRRVDDDIPAEVVDLLSALPLASGGANVIMQLSRLPIGHGVAKSPVVSGRVDKHPIKRLRTTATYLLLAVFGTQDERDALREQIDRVHRPIHSHPGDDVTYDAFDTDLQLWVAACLIKGGLDAVELTAGRPLDAERKQVLYRHFMRLGTTLQVTEEMFPPDVESFERYLAEGAAQIQMDDLTRSYLVSVADLAFLVAPLGRWGTPLRPLLRPLGRFMTLGFLPEPFRSELGLPWDDRRQRAHDAMFGAVARVVVRLPRPLREFPLNVYLWDARRRLRTGRPLI